jgi:hypothetical protein
MKKVSGWLLILWAQLPQLCHPVKNVDLLMSRSILGTTRSVMIPNLGSKEGVEAL